MHARARRTAAIVLRTELRCRLSTSGDLYRIQQKHEKKKADGSTETLSQGCETCHEPPTDTLHRQMKGNCAQCHSPQGWKPATFEHDKLFRLDGDHNASCVTCHQGNDYSRYTCYGCHEHTPDNVARKHQKEGIRDFENCVACHRSAKGDSDGHGERGGRKRD